MVLEYQKKEKFQSTLRELIVQACIENFGCKCVIDGIICVTVNLSRGNTDEVIAKFHEVVSETSYPQQQGSSSRNKTMLKESSGGSLKTYLSTNQKEIMASFTNSRSFAGMKSSARDVSQRHLDTKNFDAGCSFASDRGSEVQFGCSICLARFNGYEELEKHFQEIHSSSITHFCNICNIGFESESDCASHRRIVHERLADAMDQEQDNSLLSKVPMNRRKQQKPRRGMAKDDNGEPGCAEGRNGSEMDSLATTNSLDASKEGLTIAENNNDLNQRNHNDFVDAEMSERNESSPEDFGRHASLVHCPVCKDGFESFGGLDDHCYATHRQYICSYCYATFPQKAHKDKHVYQKHSGMKPFPCQDCDASFTRRDALKKHLPKCKGVLQVASFSPSSARNSPQMSKYSSFLEATGQNKCAELEHSIKMEVDGLDCGLDLSHTSSRRANNLDAGDVKFSANQSYHDGECAGEGTPRGRSSQNSEEEEDRASNDRLFSREDGNSNSPSQYPSRSRHFKCDWCDAVVIGGVAYSEHCKLAHRRTPCLHCGKTFSQKGNMERHKRQHTGERPFSCPECSSSYTRRETLKSHMSQAHGLQLQQPQQQIRQQLKYDQVPQLMSEGGLLFQAMAEGGLENRSHSFKDDPDNAPSE